MDATNSDVCDDDWIKDRRVAIRGKLASFSQREARDLIAAHGGIVVDADDAGAECIVVGEGQTHFQVMAGNTDQTGGVSNADLDVEVLTETELWERLGLLANGDSTGTLYTLTMLAQILNLPASTIRRWQRRGLIVAARQVNRLAYFDFSQVSAAKNLARLFADAGSSTQTLEQKLSQIAAMQATQSGSVADLDVIVDGRQVLVRKDSGLSDISGQYHLDFYALEAESDDANAQLLDFVRPAELGSPVDPQTVDQFLRQALTLEDDQDFDGAIQVYRTMLMTFGPSADTCFALAELLYARGDLAGARERYYMSVEIDETFIEAYANLGCLLLELNDLNAAKSAFETSLQYHPDYPDVHFHLAKALDALDEPQRAEVHWRRFLDLAPMTPWADDARIRLNETTAVL